MAANRAIMMKENTFRSKYERYIQSNRHDADLKRKARTAVAAKMARVAYSIVKQGESYRPYHESGIPGGKIPLARAVEAEMTSQIMLGPSAGFLNSYSKFPSIGLMWRRHWPNLIAIFDYPPEIRKVIYTTNVIESLNSVIRKSVRKRKLFPSDTAALRVVYRSAMEASKRLKRPVRDWKNALNQFAIQHDGELNFQS